jgi:BirA family biotin operon repressor/biotin-[acetyl-CoA-carboxylase] ligase
VLGEARNGVVVLGIGVNVNIRAEALPAGTRLPATSLLIETGVAVDRAPLLAEILHALETRYDAWR